MYGTLIPIGGGDDIPLKKKELIVGRKDDCDIVLRFSNVSSRHCRLVLSDGYWYVVDLNSSNGVKVNGVRVADRRVDPGAKLTIAKIEFQLDYSPAGNGAHGAPPPDLLDPDVFSKSLLDRAGLNKGRRSGGSPQKTGAQEKPKIDSVRKPLDLSKLTLDDIDMR